ncbi:hypothetical protein C8F01DRAFT_1252326 [Mycena amicta]|nr:hypothetical protein C8F01DRAFT_1252326 [Mycena amicta]
MDVDDPPHQPLYKLETRSIESTPANAELFDGLPLVQLPDSEVEVTPFLKSLLFPTYGTVFVLQFRPG